MAATTFHARSNSLPSASHPLVSEIDEQVCRLSSSSSISQKLNGLQDVYECVDKFIQLPSTQQAMIHDQTCFNELLDGSLRLLDLCNAAKDALSHTKESVAELQSAIRRRQGDLVVETKKYLNSRKIVKKSIQKALKANKVDMLIRESESMVLEVLKSLLSFISQSTSKAGSSWSVVSKLIQKRVVAASDNKFAEVDACLKTSKSSDEIQAHLKNLHPCILDLEEGTECLFRCLIKTRTSILNVHNL
ncbi:hypothetical protein LINGRAHAP2_LOCUS16372 [Linum grandiflorum]